MKDKQIALVSLQNEQLRASLGQMEAEMQVLSQTLMGKDSDLQKLTRVIKKKDDEIARLKALEQQDEGRERAVEIASKQNSSLLKLLEAQEEKTRQLTDENERLKAEITDSVAFQAKQVKRAADLEMRLRQELADSQHSFADLQLRYDDLSLRHEGFEERVRNAENDARARVATMHQELLTRRDRQYVLLQRVQDAEDRLQKVKDKEELARTNTSVLGERSEELEVRLESAMTQLRAQDEDMRTRTEQHAAVVDEFASQLGQKERGLSKLQVRTDELSSALMKMVEKHKEASSVAKAREAQAASLKEQVKGGRRQVAELEQQAAAAARTLEQVRNRGEALRESEAALKGQVEHLQGELTTRQRKPAAVKGADARQLEAEAKGRAMAARAYLALFGFASKCGYIFAEDGSVVSSASAAVPVPHGPVDFLQSLNLSECAMRDTDLSGVVDVASRCRQLRSVSLSYNFLTDAAVPMLASLLNHPTSRVEFLDVRNNQISIEGIRALALILEGTITRGIKHVYIQRDGQIEAIGDAGLGVSTAPGSATASATVVKIDARENFGEWATQAPPVLGPQTTQLAKEKQAQRTPAALAKMERAAALRKRKQKDTWRNRVLDDVYGNLSASYNGTSSVEVSQLSRSLAELPEIAQSAAPPSR